MEAWHYAKMALLYNTFDCLSINFKKIRKQKDMLIKLSFCLGEFGKKKCDKFSK